MSYTLPERCSSSTRRASGDSFRATVLNCSNRDFDGDSSTGDSATGTGTTSSESISFACSRRQIFRQKCERVLQGRFTSPDEQVS